MDRNLVINIEKIITIFLLISSIAIGFAQCVPWGEISIERPDTQYEEVAVLFYSWGMRRGGFHIQGDNLSILYHWSIHVISFFQRLRYGVSLSEFITSPVDTAAFFLTVLVFPFCLFAVVVLIQALRNFQKNKDFRKILLFGFFFSVLSVVFFLFYVYFGLYSSMLTDYVWSVGFYLMLFAVILITIVMFFLIPLKKKVI